MFVITGATGNTGSVAAEILLKAGKKVRAVVRDAAKGSKLAKLGAELFVADLSDQAALGRALEGAEGVYLLSPPDLAATNFVVDRKALTEKQSRTVAAAKPGHVVLLSSIAAQHAEGTGPIQTIHNFEQQLRATGLPVSFVRAAYFVENWGAVLHPVKQDGVLPSFLPAEKKMPMVSTRDIGAAVAQALLDGPRGTRVIELSGPVDVSPKDVAATFARLLNKPVNVVEAPLGAVVPTFTSFGISSNVAQLFQEMYGGLASGKVAWEGRDAEAKRGTISLETTLSALLG